MEEKHSVKYFLGANSPQGFYSLYNSFTDHAEERLYIIKSGPGSGKSTYMRIISEEAERAGYMVERILCSGDPDSLDAVKIPALGLAWVDGTSPHVIEPAYAGSGDVYVDLNRFYDTEGLRREHGTIIELTDSYKSWYTRAYKLVSAAAAVCEGLTPKLPDSTVSSAERRVKGIISRELTKQGSGGKVQRRFLSALSFKGEMCLWNTVEALADKVYVLDNELGLGTLMLERLASAAAERGHDAVHCFDPMAPQNLEHIILPRLGLAFLTQRDASKCPIEPYRHLCLDAMPTRRELAELRPMIRSRNREAENLKQLAVDALKKAKELHDKLEERYNPYVDFDGVRAAAKDAANMI